MLATNLILRYHHVRTILAYQRRDWRGLPIKENNELLVQIPESICFPYYAEEMKITKDRRIFLREEVAERYLNAKAKVKAHGYDLVVYDGWRSLEVQESLFWLYLKEFTVRKFNQERHFAAAITPTEIKACFELLPMNLQITLRESNRTYASWPSADPLCPSPHVTGGSVDVWLHQEGKPVSLGVPFDWMEKDAGAFYHLHPFRKKVLPLDAIVSKRRSILLSSMINAGFTCYGPEFWHFNHGNQMDSVVTRKMAKYSIVQPV